MALLFEDIENYINIKFLFHCAIRILERTDPTEHFRFRLRLL